MSHDATTSYAINLTVTAQDAFTHLGQGISVFDAELNLVFFNQLFSDLLGFPKDFIRNGISFEALIRYNADRGEYGPGDKEVQVAERMALAKKFQAHSFQRVRPEDGVVIQVDGSPMASGGFVTTYTDITDKVHKEEFYSSIIQTSPVGFAISHKSDGHIVFCNEPLAKQHGYSVDEMLGSVALNLYADATDRNALMQRLEAEGTIRDHAIKFQRKDGSIFDALISLRSTIYEGVPSVFAWIYDISSLQQMQLEKAELERELNQAQKLEAVGQLAGGIAHEINTPSQYVGDNLQFISTSHVEMTSLLISALQLVDDVKDIAAFKAQAQAVNELSEEIDLEYLLGEIPIATSQAITGISQISRIVLAMKEFSHPGNADKSFMDINHMIENTVTISRNEWKLLAKMEFDFDPLLPQTCCLPGDLNQVFLSIVVNAAHAIDACKKDSEGEIRISTSSDEKWVTIKISDNGSGIPKEIQGNIFEPFFTTKGVGKGTGQGLSIARNIVVKKHHGEIFCDSVEGEGTTFTIHLPIDGGASL